jgi:hypothetical protein
MFLLFKSDVSLTNYKMNRKSATEQELRAYSLEMDKQAEADVMNWLA